MEQKFKTGDLVKDHLGRIFKVTKCTNCYFFYEQVTAFDNGEKGRCQFSKNSYSLASTEDVEHNNRKIALQKERVKLRQVTKKLDKEVSYYSCKYLKIQKMIEISEFLEEKLKDIVHD